MTIEKQQNNQTKDQSKVLFEDKKPLEEATLWQKLFFTWTTPIIDHVNSGEKLKPEHYGQPREQEKIQKSTYALKENFEMLQKKRPDSRWNIAWACMLTFKTQYVAFMLVQVFKSVFSLTVMARLHANVAEFFASDATSMWEALYFTIWQVSITVGFNAFFCNILDYWKDILLKEKAVNSIRQLVQLKHFRMSPATTKQFEQGEMIEMTNSHDSYRIVDMPEFFLSVIILPFELIYCAYTLHAMLGWSIMAGVITKICGFGLAQIGHKLWRNLHEECLPVKDDRIENDHEPITNMKMLKIQGWQDKFEDDIQKNQEEERERHLKVRNIANWCFRWSGQFWALTPLAIFATYVYNGNTINLATSLVAQTYIHTLSSKVDVADWKRREYEEVQKSLKKLYLYIAAPELQSNIIKQDEYSEDAIKIKGSFSWGLDENEKANDKPIDDYLHLKDLDLSIKKGEFVCVIGEIGSGKTNLLRSVIGDMVFVPDESKDEKDLKKLQATLLEPNFWKDKPAPITLNGNLSYVEQTSWIQNMTVRENILFGSEFDKRKYVETITACQLETDIKDFKAGDQTEIGEKGINLSGGQKARVSLARAVYQDADIILMDDPISALDAVVRASIYKEVFSGLLKDKTRVLCTHAVEFLHLADKIVVMKEGRVEKVGSWASLANDPYLMEICSIHSENREGLALTKKNSTKDNLSVPVTKNCSTTSEDCGIPTLCRQLSMRTVDQKLEELSLTKTGEAEEEAAKSGKLDKNEDEDDDEVEIEAGTYYKVYLVIGGAAVVIPLLLSGMTDDILYWYREYQQNSWANQTQEEQKSTFMSCIQIVSGLQIFTAMQSFMRHDLIHRQGDRMDMDMKNKVRKNVFNAPINLYFDVKPLSKTLRTMNEDVNVFEHLLWHVQWIVSRVAKSAFMIVNIAYFSPILLPVIALVAYMYTKNTAYIRKTDEEIERVNRKIQTPNYSFVTETLPGLSTIRAHNKERYFEEKSFDLKNQNIQVNLINSTKGRAVGQTQVFQNQFLLASAILALTWVKGSAVDGVYLSMLATSIRGISEDLRIIMDFKDEMVRKMKRAQRCFNIQKIAQEKQTAEIEIADDEWPSKGQIKFDDVVLKYRPELETVLNKLSFDIAAGEKVGIVGRTAAGKSTITMALTRIIELTSGKVEIDGIDISKVHIKQLRKKITMIPQDPVIFTGSLRFNLDPFGTQTDEKIEELVKELGLEQLLTRPATEIKHWTGKIREVKNEGVGIYYRLSAGGENLSAGQKALICIGRAILEKNKVVILDEATASIDVETEKRIQNLMHAHFKDATVITIAHRLNTIISSDKILVLAHGQLEEFDSPKNLMRNPDSRFTQLLNKLQKKG